MGGGRCGRCAVVRCRWVYPPHAPCGGVGRWWWAVVGAR